MGEASAIVPGRTMAPTRGGRLASIAALVVGAVSCGRWADKLACHDEGCRFTSAEWDRVKSLTDLRDPPEDPSNGLLVRVRARPAGEQLSDDIVRLGWALYYDNDLAGPPTWKDMLGRPSGTARASALEPTDPDDKVKVSCATCHDPEHGGGDVTSVPRHIAVGAGWYDVNSQQTLNVGHYRYLYWNGRADSVWSQAAQVMESSISVNGDRLAIVATVRAKYAVSFGGLLAEWDLPATTDPARCVAADNCPEPDCHLVNHFVTGAKLCRPAFPAHGKRGNRVGCQYGSDEPFNDDFDCMRPEDQVRATKGYVNIAKAIAAYEWFLTSTDSPFDVFVREGPASPALPPEAQRGLKLFVGRAGCIDCHRGPMLSDGEFHNIGVPQTGDGVPTVADCLRKETAAACDCVSGRRCLPWGACEGIQRLTDQPRAPADRPALFDPDGGATNPLAESCTIPPAGPEPKDNEPSRLSSYEFSRVSRWSDDPTPLPPPALRVVKGSWRTPSLRDVALTGPYMHDGVFGSLADVIWHYDQGVAANDIGPTAVEIKPLRLSSQDRSDLVAFLKSLTGKPRVDRDVARPPGSCPRYAENSDGGCPGGPAPGSLDAGAGGP
jgi:cytochrome c peroxidase